jgi:hypothetical protein
VSLEQLTDLRTPWCVHVAATLGVADHIAAGTSDVRELAAAVGCDADALHAVLSHLASKQVFVETAPGRFELTDLGHRLREQAPFLDLSGIGGRMAHAWSTLLAYTLTGRSGYRDLFGRSFWEDLAANPELAESFDSLMGIAGHGTPNAQFELAGGWERVHTVIDVGGGTGAMLSEILRRHPHVRGTLLDLPGTVQHAQHSFDAADVGERAATIGQSFFEPIPEGADLYLLRKVLNDWPDEETVLILQRCAEAARPDGRVVVIGGVAPDDAPARLEIEMLLVGGRSDGVARFSELSRQAELEVIAAAQQPAGFVVECRPI